MMRQNYFILASLTLLVSISSELVAQSSQITNLTARSRHWGSSGPAVIEAWGVDLWAFVADPQGPSDIDSVWVDGPNGFHARLYDDGNNYDGKANDGQFAKWTGGLSSPPALGGYYFKVKDRSGNVSTATDTLTAILDYPRNVTPQYNAVVSIPRFTISWDKVKGATGYYVDVKKPDWSHTLWSYSLDSSQLSTKYNFNNAGGGLTDGGLYIVYVSASDVNSNQSERLNVRFAYRENDRRLVYVNSASTSGDKNGTASNPFSTISDALAATVSRDTVLVAAGTYDGRINDVGSITLLGKNPLTTIIRGYVALRSKDVTIKGFTIMDSDRAGIEVHENVNARILTNIITRNAYGGILHAWDGPSNVIIANNTIVFNGDFGIKLENFGSGVTILNNIIAFNRVGVFRTMGVAISNKYNNYFSNSNNNFSGLLQGEGEILTDPKLIEYLGGNYNLQSTSPCIDAGNPDTDGDGITWINDPDDRDPDGTRLDMGALYFDQRPTVTLISPLDNATGVATNPVLQWSAVTGAVSYHLQLSTTPGFALALIDDTTLTSAMQQITSLSNETTYFWRVRAKNAFGYGPFSPTASFTTIIAVPSAVTLLSPTDGSKGISINPLLTWGAFAGAASYHLQLSSTSDFTTQMVDDTTITATSRRCGPLVNNATYYWRVRRKNSVGYGQYSPKWSFTTMPPYASTVDVFTVLAFPTKTNAADYAATDYRLLGLPGSSDILAKDIVTGVQNEDWEIVWDNGAASDYLKRYDGSADFKFSVGKAFWIISKSPLSIARTVPSASLNAAQEAEISLRSGWNLVTNPFDKSVPWTRIQTTNGITGAIYSFNGAFNNATTLDPYAGYYFFNGTPSPVLTILRVPFSSAFGKLTELEVKKENGWRVSIEVSTGGETPALSEAASGRVEGEDVHPERGSEATESRGETIEIGVEGDARDGLDGYDQRMPRSLEKAGMYFDRPEWDDTYSEFGKDIKAESNQLKRWVFTVEGKLLQKKIIHVTGVESIPSTEDVFLVDKERGLVVDLRCRQEYTTEMVKGKMRFEILVGRRKTVEEETEKLLPTEIKVGPNYPNPFNPETVIPIELPKTMDVKIVIYDILGRTIKTVYDGMMESGKHYVRWDGKDEQQMKQASGVYLYRASLGNVTKVSGRIVMVQ